MQVSRKKLAEKLKEAKHLYITAANSCVIQFAGDLADSIYEVFQFAEKVLSDENIPLYGPAQRQVILLIEVLKLNLKAHGIELPKFTGELPLFKTDLERISAALDGVLDER